MNQNAQLHIVGSVKALQLFVQGSRIGHRPRFQRHACSHILFPGMLQSLQGHQSGFAFQQLDLHHTPVNTLRRQIGLADHIPFVVVQVIDRPGNGIQIRQRHGLADIWICYLLQFRFRQHFRRVCLYFCQGKGKRGSGFLRCFQIGFYLRFLLLPVFFQLPGSKLPFHIFPGLAQLGTGIDWPGCHRRPGYGRSRQERSRYPGSRSIRKTKFYRRR